MSTPELPHPHIEGYRHVAFLGSGGFGEVHHYRHEATNASVAIKVLRPAKLAQGGTEQLLREAQALGRLSDGGAHPNIVAVQNVGTADGRPYLMMEYCPGGSWAQQIEKAGRLLPSTVLSVGIQIAGALHLAHELGIVHRDIKPGNILLGRQATPKLADFGIAALTAEEISRGSVWLSRDYAAPEVVLSRGADRMSDIFSLAATLYHALAGRSWVRLPGEDKNSPEELEERIVQGKVPEIVGNDVPDGLKSLILGAMHHDVRKRAGNVGGSAMEFALKLQDIQLLEGFERTRVPIDDVEAVSISAPLPPPPPHKPVEQPAPPSQPHQATFDSDLVFGLGGSQVDAGRGGGDTELAGRRGDTKPADQLEVNDPKPPRSKKVWLVLAGVALVAAAVAGVNLFFHPTATRPDAVASRTAPGDDAIPDRPALPVPVITGKRDGSGVVTFEWTYATPAAGDRFNVQRSGQGKAELVDSPKWTSATPVEGNVCIRVALIRDGQVGLPSEQVCA